MVFGEAKRRATIGRRIKESKRSEQELYNLVRRAQGPVGRQVPVFSGGAANIQSGASGGAFLKTAGDTMMGPIAFFPALVTISSGAIDIGKSTDNFSSRVIVTPESGSTDDLVTISNAEHNGQLLFLQGIQTDTITLKNSGNIETIDGNDFDIVDDDIIIFQFDVTDNKWQQVTIGKQSSGGVSFPITPTVDVRGSVTTAQAVDISQTDGHVTTMTLGADVTVTFSGFPSTGTQQTWELHILQDGTGGRILTVSPTPVETFTIASGANLLTILTFLTNDGGTDIHVVPALRGTVSFSSNFLPLAGGTMTGNIDMDNNNIIDINDLLFNETGQSIISDTGGLNVSVDTGQTVEWFEAGSPSMTLNASQNLDLEGHNLLGVNTLTVAALAAFNGAVSLGNAIGDIITVSGEIGSNIAMGGFNIVNGGNVQADTFDVINAGAGADPQFISNDAAQILNLTGTFRPSTDGTFDLGSSSLEWQDLFIDGTANIDTLAATTMAGTLTMGTNTITGIDELEFTDDATSPASSVAYMNFDTSVMQENVPLGDSYTWAIDNVVQLTLDTSNLTMNSVDLDMNNNDIGNCDDILFNTAGCSILHTSGTLNYRTPVNQVHTFSIDGNTILDVQQDIIDELQAHRFASFSDGTRPSASTALAGAVFYSTTDGFLLYSDGTNWKNVHDNATT